MIVHNKGKYIRHIGDVRIIPGVNEIKGSQEKAFKSGLKNPLNKFLVDNEEIIVIEEQKSDDKKADKPKEGIKLFNAKEAAKAIKDTFDLSLLEQWLEQEKGDEPRSTVIEAIENQINGITNPNEDDVVKTDEDDAAGLE